MMSFSAGLISWIFGIGISGYLGPNILVFILASFFIIFVILVHRVWFEKGKNLLQTILPCVKVLLCLGIYILGTWYYQGYIHAVSQKAQKFACENPAQLCGVVVSEVHTYDQTAYFTLKEENGLKISVKIRTSVPIVCGERVYLPNPVLIPVNPLNDRIQATGKLLGNHTFLSGTFPYQAEVKKAGIGNYALYFGKRLRLATAECLRDIFPADIAHFLTALFSSDRSEMPEEMYNSFLATGTVHIVVVSGMHFNYLMGALLFLFSFLFPSRRKRLMLSFVVLLLFVGYTGATLPVLRSFLMMSVGFFCDLFYVKPAGKLKTMLVLVSVFLTITPTLIFNPSFLLSFGAALGLTAFCRPIEQSLNWIPIKPLRSFLATYVSVSLMTFPIILFYFGKMPLVSVVANFLVGPLVAPILILCVIILAAFRVPFLSGTVIFLERNLSALFLWLVKMMSAVPVSWNLHLKDSVFLFLMSGVSLLAWSAQSARKLTQWGMRIAVIFCLVLAVTLQHQPVYSARMLVTFFGASNTNSAAIFTPNDRLILYGNGTDLIYGQTSAAYRENQPVEILILTSLSNPDEVAEFLKNHPINRIILPYQFRGMLPEHPNIQWLQSPVSISIDGVHICLNTDGSSILEAEFSYANQPLSFTQNSSYLLEHMQMLPQKNWVFNFARSSKASSMLNEISIPTKLFSKKQWHRDQISYNNYSIIQADASGVRLLSSAEQEP